MLKKILVLVLVLAVAGVAEANVVIKVRAINPLDKAAVAPIQYPLPKEIRPEHIVAKRIKLSGGVPAKADKNAPPPPPPEFHDANFAIKYDRKNQNYYIDHRVRLAPKEIVTLEVEVEDIWNISEEDVNSLRSQLNAMMTGREETLDATARSLKEEIMQALDEILQRQDKNTAKDVGVEKHLDAYAQNVQALNQVKMDMAMMKNLLEEPVEKKGKQ